LPITQPATWAFLNVSDRSVRNAVVVHAEATPEQRQEVEQWRRATWSLPPNHGQDRIARDQLSQGDT
jgi:hypothetical protein